MDAAPVKFHAPLLRGTLIKRYKRFMADVRLDDGTVVVAHCANSGSMLSVCDAGSEVWLSPAANPDRKLQYSWELIRIGEALVGINTMHPNRIAAEAITEGLIPELTGYTSLRREVKYGKNSRIDILLEAAGRPPCYVEIKNVTLCRGPGLLEFPDAVTARGAKHLDELMDQVRAGHRAVMLFLAQRGDCHAFVAAADIDPAYADGLRRARGAGVEVLAYACDVSQDDIRVGAALALN
jgi:sugar fermentation stimulation protein A